MGEWIDMFITDNLRKPAQVPEFASWCEYGFTKGFTKESTS